MHLFDENGVATQRTTRPEILGQPLVAGVSISRATTHGSVAARKRVFRHKKSTWRIFCMRQVLFYL
jgi:hypothetical protein